MMKRCHSCGTSFSASALSCSVCGSANIARKSDEPAGAKSSLDRQEDGCLAVSGGRRCKFPATIKNGDEWWCRLHFRCPHGEAYDAAISASDKWSADVTARDVPTKYTTWEGKQVQGFPSRRQIESEFSAKIEKVKPGDFRALMLMLRPKSPSKDWATELKEREASGDQLLPAQMRAWREALNHV